MTGSNDSLHDIVSLLQGIYFSVEHSPRPDDDLSLLSNDIPMTGSNDSLHDIDIVICYRVYTSV